jgi:hypothetical protein
MRNRSGHRKPVPRRLAQVLALAALAVGVLPATTAVADNAARHPTQTQTVAATWVPFVTLDPAHVSQLPKGELLLFGVYAFTPDLVNFDPRRIPGSVPQAAVPTIVVPDDNAHTYKAVFHLTTDVTTTTSYQLNGGTPITVAGGVTDVEFTVTFQQQKGWHNWSLRNANGDHWLFYRCDFYELTS